MNDTTSAAPSDEVLRPDDSEFEQWYATMFKPAMERSPFDKYVARQAWYAAWNRRAPQPVAREPMEVDVSAVNGINARIHFRRGWRAAEAAHGIGTERGDGHG